MKIVRLTAENVKRLVAVEIEPAPDGSLVIVAGKNAQGKSSVLDSIWLTLGGKDAKKTNTRPVRDGETTAFAELDLGEIIVRREWSGETSKLTVMSAAGAHYPSPQKMLDELVGKMSFDPVSFLRADQKEQRRQLLEVVDVGFDPDEFERKRKAVYDERTEVGREVRRLQGAWAKFREAEPGIEGISPSERIDVTALAQEYSRCSMIHHRQVELTNEIERLQQELAQLGTYIPPEELAAQERELRAAEQHNRNVDLVNQRASIQLDLAVATDKQVELTEKLDQAEAYKAQQIAAAQMPVAGLSFNDDGLTYNGVPLSQASGAEQLRVAVGVAMAANPKIRVIRITDGSLLDRESMAMLEKLASAKDFQVWIERVEDDSPMAVVIEDGSVVKSPS